MFYIIYKTTNLINSKLYIGKHQTTDLHDDYLGSGKLLKLAITKYGKSNFIRETIFIFDNEDEMNQKETELVTEEFCLRNDTYNICVGGKGGFSYINRDDPARAEKKRKAMKAMNEKHRHTISERSSNAGKANYKKHGLNLKWFEAGRTSFKGKTHSEASKAKIAESMSKMTGSKNSQFGTMWITDGASNKKIQRVDTIPDRWYKGRTMPH
jgi:hypothetical protein